MPKINAAGLAIIREFEGCRLTAYADAGGIPTIGYGHTGDLDAIGIAGAPRLGMTITQEQAERLLEADVASSERCVQGLAQRDLTPNQFSALVSFAYNVGCEQLAGSTLMRLINAGNVQAAANEFLRWTYADGVQLPGLVRRRSAERQLFLAP